MRYIIANANKDIDAISIDDVLRIKTIDGAAGLVWKDEQTATQQLAESGMSSTMKVFSIPNEIFAALQDRLVEPGSGFTFRIIAERQPII